MSPIHQRISSVQSLFDAFIETVPEDSRLHDEVARLRQQLSRLLALPATAALKDQWGLWCERFEKLQDNSYEKQLLELYIALPN